MLFLSHCQGTISFKESLLYPNDPESGVMRKPDVFLTYQDFVRYDFDPHTALYIAYEYIKSHWN